MSEYNVLLSRTVEHFKEIARQNRFAENRNFEHDPRQCLICHPELFPIDPFVVYLRVVTEAIKVRRPRLDQELVDEINRDRALLGKHGEISIQSLMDGDREAVVSWYGWVREAVETGLALLSVHSRTSLEYTLEEVEARGFGHLIEARINEIIALQKENS